MEKLKVDPSTYDAIEKVIASDVSPVGIDAKQTHIIIIDKLLKLEKRLEAIEKRLQNGGSRH